MIVAMDLLVLGGTVFVGRAIVESAIERGHRVTLFHRGQRGADLFEGEVERIIGDRAVDLSALSGRSWDAVVDTCGYLPKVVRKSAQALSSATPIYAFVSSISVYDRPQTGADEQSPLVPIGDPDNESIDAESYGYLKVLCEREVQSTIGDGALIVRPGLVVGPNDPTDRFTYWVLRMARGGDVLVPGTDQPSQFIDARDLAGLVIGLLERREAGVLHATGPQPPHRLRGVLETCRNVCNPDANLRWASPEFLDAQGVKPWSELPLYLGMDAADYGSMAVDASKAIAAGLTLRPLEDTIRETLAWARQARANGELKAGLTAETENRLLRELEAATPRT